MTYLLIARQSPKGEHIILYNDMLDLKHLSYTEFIQVEGTGVVLSNEKCNTYISATALQRNFELISSGETLVYHVEDGYSRQSGMLVFHHLLLVNKAGVRRTRIPPNELRSCVMGQVGRGDLLAHPLNAELLFDDKGISKFSAVYGEVNKIIV